MRSGMAGGGTTRHTTTTSSSSPIPARFGPGGTTFHFVTNGIEKALERAREAAGGKDVKLWGGAQVIQQYLAAGRLDELELHVVPVLLGGGARLFDNLTDADVRLEQVSGRSRHWRHAPQVQGAHMNRVAASPTAVISPTTSPWLPIGRVRALSQGISPRRS
jgi:dihydrofolate reductase